MINPKSCSQRIGLNVETFNKKCNQLGPEYMDKRWSQSIIVENVVTIFMLGSEAHIKIAEWQLETQRKRK